MIDDACVAACIILKALASWLMMEEGVEIPLNSLMSKYITDLFIHFKGINKKKKKTSNADMVIKTRLSDSVEAEIDLAKSHYLLSPGSSDALTAVIQMTVLT